MSKTASSAIRLRGVRQNNLKNLNLDLPTGKLIVFTGLSGSGKSSLAFDTLFAEGQRRYIETFSPYARQFFDRMDKPAVDSIENIPPAIALEGKNSVKSTRSTVGTMTEVCDFMKMVWPIMAELYCRQCEQKVTKEPPGVIWDRLLKQEPTGSWIAVAFELPLSDRLSPEESLSLLKHQGYARVLSEAPPVGSTFRAPALDTLQEVLPKPYGAIESPNTEITRIEDFALGDRKKLIVLQDRIRLEGPARGRFVEACEQAYHFGKGRLTVYRCTEGRRVVEIGRFSSHFHCAPCDIEYREPVAALFSFNHPLGACPKCRGFGRTIDIDMGRAIPDPSLTLAQGVVKPWTTETGKESQADLMKFCKKQKIPTDIPFRSLPPETQRWVIEGDPNYGTDSDHEWPRAWYGVRGYFKWLESKAYKMHVRVLLARYRQYVQCPACEGKRLQPESLHYRADGLSLADFYQLSITKALNLLKGHRALYHPQHQRAIYQLFDEVCHRLHFLCEVGLGYLTLDRPTRSLSGGETERVNLTSCLGTRLVNTLFVLDEPSVGLHSLDTSRLIRILEQLRDLGNTVAVVEHDASIMRAADHLVDLGPYQGERGGELMYEGNLKGLLKARGSLTGQYLSGSRTFPHRVRRPILPDTTRLQLRQASLHNLLNVSVDFPLARLVCVTGVSGSGKSTLIREVLFPLLQEKLGEVPTPADIQEEAEASIAARTGSQLSGYESLSRVLLVDQSSLGRTPRSNPVVYIGAFDLIRELFAQTPQAKQLGFNASAFSFNSGQGQCQQCRGAGFEKIEMQFLSDIYVRCAQCDGARYRPHILKIKLQPDSKSLQGVGGKSIGEVLQMSVDESIEFFKPILFLKKAQDLLQRLTLLHKVGLGYLRLGQSINTLSGGESQRLKLVGHLAEHQRKSSSPTLFLFDEPTTGLHFEDVRVLLEVFHQMVEAGHSLILIEHQLDVIRSSDWVIDLGPGAGSEGGRLVAEGTPEDLLKNPASPTGQALRAELNPSEVA